MTARQITAPSSRTYVLILDGTERARELGRRLLDGGDRLVVVSTSSHDVVAFSGARWSTRVWPVIADPADDAQMDEILARTTRRFGRISMVIDPSGLVADIARADARLSA